jgi:hypothetical protein
VVCLWLEAGLPTCLGGQGGLSRGLKGGAVSLLGVDSMTIPGRRRGGLSVLYCMHVSDGRVMERELPLFERHVWLCERGGVRGATPLSVPYKAGVAWGRSKRFILSRGGYGSLWVLCPGVQESKSPSMGSLEQFSGAKDVK